MRVSGVRVDGRDEWRRTQFVRGWHREELDAGTPFRWSSGHALLRVPAGATVELRLGSKPEWQPVVPEGPVVDVVNNAGSILVEGGYGADRGFQEVDRGQYDEPAEVFAWCGASALLRRAYIDDVGGFDERLFLYYEDFDLAWRGRARGWRYLYVPDSVVRHVHTASSVEGSARFDYYVERNRLLVHAKNAPAGYAAQVAFGALRMTPGDRAARSRPPCALPGPAGLDGRPPQNARLRGVSRAAPGDAGRALPSAAEATNPLRRADEVVGTVVSAMAVDVKALPAPARWRHFVYVTSALTATEFKLRYFGSVLGYLWTLLRPLMIFGVLYLVFTEIFRFGGDVPHYAVMLLLGLMLWNFFADATGSSLPSLVQRESLLRKVAFPRAAIPIAVSMTAAANLFLGLIVVFFFALVDGVTPRASWLGMIPIVLGILVFAAGLALLLSALYVRFRDVQPIWEVGIAAPLLGHADHLHDRVRS